MTITEFLLARIAYGDQLVFRTVGPWQEVS